MHNFAELVIRKRVLVLIGTILATLFFSYQLLNLKVYTSFADLLPQNHPYVKLHNEFRKLFGGANQVLIALQVKEGDIFTVETLRKIKYVTEKLEEVPAIDVYKIRSLASRSAKEIKRAAEALLLKR